VRNTEGFPTFQQRLKLDLQNEYFVVGGGVRKPFYRTVSERLCESDGMMGRYTGAPCYPIGKYHVVDENGR
jgi:hypothetical protein